MEVEVRLFATLRQGRFKTAKMDFASGSKVADVLDRLAIAAQDVAILLVNGREALPQRDLTGGDVVSLFPAVGGG